MQHERISRRRARASVSLGLTAVLASSLAAAEPVQVPGSPVSMEPPAGFRLSESFTGFENPDTQSSILVAELPADAYPEVSTIFGSQEAASEAFAAQGVTVSEVSTITVDGKSVDLVIGEQGAGAIDVGKYLVVLPGESTVLVTINAVGEGGPDRDAAVAALESITLSAPPSLAERLELLPFGFETVAPFETRRVMAGSTVLLTTFEDEDPTGKQPVVIIASALADMDTSDPQAASERLLAATRGFENARVGEGESVDAGNAKAWRVEVEDNGILAIHYLWSLPDGYYLRLLASGASDELAPLRDAVARIAASVEPRTGG